MPALKLLNLFTLASVALVALSSAPLHARAQVANRAQVARHVHAHHPVAKRKRSDSSSLCTPRPSSSVDSSVPTSTPAPPSSTSTTSTAPSATPSTTSTTSSSSRGKGGLAWPNGDQWLSNFADLSNVGYLYTWSAYLPDNLASYGIEGMPILWGSAYVDQFQQLVVPGYAKYAMGFNEPNEPSQANLSPGDAASLWKQYLDPLAADGYYLISPACTDDDSGLAWYEAFFAACSGCTIHGVAYHSYVTDPQHLIDYANTLHNTYGLEVWITEFADENYTGTGGQATMDEIWTYAETVKAFCDGTDWIRGYFPFGAMTDLQGVNTLNALLDPSTGEPTQLGYFYFN